MKIMWKTVLCGFFCCLVVYLTTWFAPVSTHAADVHADFSRQYDGETEQHLQLYASSAVLMDGVSGRILYGKNENQVMPMASTTKVMTAIVILEELKGNLEGEVAVSNYAAGMPKVKLYIKKGEKYKAKDLMYSLMLESHNDSAVALAEHVGKEYIPELKGREASEFTTEESKMAVEAFARLMNRKAAWLGCDHTYFITPNGLDAQEDLSLLSGKTITQTHSTTAVELARIFSYCILRSPYREEFLKITRTERYIFSSLHPGNRNFSCTNHNAFLHMMPGALSGKTGFTNQAGYCYVGALESEGRTFVVALLACGWPSHKNYKWSDTKQLMQYGMKAYTYRDFSDEMTAYPEGRLPLLEVEGGERKVLGEIAMVPLAIRREIYEGVSGALMREEESVRVQCYLPRQIKAPVLEGTIVGGVVYSVDGNTYKKEYIYATKSIEKISFRWCVRQVWERYAR